jgi:hypothetical protein
MFKDHGLSIQKVSWEDTARDKGSCLGPNISDMTLSQNNELYPMIRKPNMSDRTMDIPIKHFQVPVGNEKGETLKSVSLKEYLENVDKYVDYNSEKIGNLFNKRDEVVLTQTQSCVLDCPNNKTVDFCPRIFNYQSWSEPRVLTITISSKGTSTQVIKGNTSLYFNNNGKAHMYSASRVANEREKKTGKPQKAVQSFNELDKDEKLENCLMIIQVPLKQQLKSPMPRMAYSLGGMLESEEEECFDGAVGGMFCNDEEESDDDFGNYSRFNKKTKKAAGFDMASLGLGSHQGEFKFSSFSETKLERDERFPIRCTYQYYRVSDTTQLSQKLVDTIAEELKDVEHLSVAKGSLVYAGEERQTNPNLKQKDNSEQPSKIWNNINGMLFFYEFTIIF